MTHPIHRISTSVLFFLMIGRPPTSPLFPYTTLFRSVISNDLLPATLECPCCGWQGRRFLDYRSEEHTSELQSHSFTSYAVFSLTKHYIACRRLAVSATPGRLSPSPSAVRR